MKQARRETAVTRFDRAILAGEQLSRFRGAECVHPEVSGIERCLRLAVQCAEYGRCQGQIAHSMETDYYDCLADRLYGVPQIRRMRSSPYAGCARRLRGRIRAGP